MNSRLDQTTDIKIQSIFNSIRNTICGVNCESLWVQVSYKPRYINVVFSQCGS